MTINQVNSTGWGTACDVGWIGFTRTFDCEGDAIAYGERFEQGAAPSVNHALVIVGPNRCVQAHMDNGIQFGKLSDYLDDPKSRVYVRKPLGWNNGLGYNIANAALLKIGCKYDDLLIAENALADTMAGHFLNNLFKDWPHEILDRVIEKLTPGEMICSFLAAYALAAQPCYKGFPLFTRPLSSIDPQLLLVAGPFEPFLNAVIPPGQPAT